MSIQFDEPIEAIMAMLFAVSAADSDISADEFLSTHPLVRAMAAPYSDEELADLQIRATRKFFDTFDTASELSAADMAALTTAMKAVFSKSERLVAFQVAVEAAYANELDEREQALLAELQSGLDVPPERAAEIIAAAKS